MTIKTETIDVASTRSVVRNGLITLVLIMLPLTAITGCERKTVEEVKPSVAKPEAAKLLINLKETRLALIPEDYTFNNITFSRDGQRVRYTAKSNNGTIVAAGSADGEKKGDAYESVSWLISSPDDSRFAYAGKKKGKKRLVIDNKEYSDLSNEEVAPTVFSPDGRLLASELGSLQEKKWFISVIEGKREVYRSRTYPESFREPSFSPDGRLLVFELGRDDKDVIQNRTSTLFFIDVTHWKTIGEKVYAGDTHAGKVSFSSDSARVIYEVKKENKSFLVLYDYSLNEERTIEIPYPYAASFSLTPDGSKILYLGLREGKYYLVVSTWELPAERKEFGPYDGTTGVVFGPDRATPFYLAMEKGKWRSVAGGREGSEKYYAVEGPVLSSDGTRMAFAGVKGGFKDMRNMTDVTDARWVMVVLETGNPAAVREGPAYDRAVSPVFSPDNRRIAYRARTGPMENAKRFIVIADAETGKVIKEGPVSDEIWPPVFSPDGKFVGYGARIGRELWWKVEPLQ